LKPQRTTQLCERHHSGGEGNVRGCAYVTDCVTETQETYMKPLITGAVGVCLLLSTEAGAQVEPGFKLEALSFKAIHETGRNWPGSDEVYVTIHVPGHAATISKIFGDVDAGETHRFPVDQSCIYPIAGLNGPTVLHGHFGATWTCDSFGAAVPDRFSFTVVLREKDSPCPPPPLGCFEPGFSPVPGGEPGPIHDVDDLIGRREVVYSKEELIALHRGQELVESVRLSPPCPVGQDVCDASDTDYQFTWRITRIH
jgi:hypothetical protein